jgi:alginate O-acetyltransferase complex protein AlgI
MRFATFLSFFPAFVAGPISRGSQFLPQLQEGIRIRREFLVEGASIFTQGLAKKVLIADRLRTVVDPVFANPERYPPWTVAAGIVAYSLQIYCDFAGYSDMAVGAARAIGLELPQNFQMPYVATSITEFWHRWHITLSTWLRDYIFLPIAYVGSRRVDELGLSRRRGELLNYTVASIITMLVAGLWHGVGWGFLLWGGAHGVALSIHRISQTTGRRRRHMASWLGRVLTFLFVSLAWVPFRAPSVGEAARIYVSLFGLGTQRTYQWFPSWLPICSAAVVLGHLLLLWTTGPGSQPSSSVAKRLMGALGLTAVHRQFAGSNLVPVRITVLGAYFITLFILSILLFSPANLGPFVYGAF